MPEGVVDERLQRTADLLVQPIDDRLVVRRLGRGVEPDGLAESDVHACRERDERTDEREERQLQVLGELGDVAEAVVEDPT
jgi:hypothetical protein